MTARRLKASLKGWGGVGAMAVACALTAAIVLPPVTEAGEAAHGVRTGGPGVADALQTKADSCADATAQDQSPAPSGADGTTIQKIKARTGDKRKLIIGVDQNSYRWGYRDPNSAARNSELEGFDIDLAKRIAKEVLGSEDDVQFRAIPTNQRVPAIQSGRVDMVVRTMTINCKRLQQVAFSAPYFQTGQQVLAPKKSDIKGYDGTLKGKTVCVAAGSTALDRLEADRKKNRPAPGIKVLEVDNQLDCLVRLQLGRADAVVTDGALAAGQAAQDPTVELKGKPFTREFYGVAMKKDAVDLARRVNQVLVDYRTSGGWQSSYTTWLAADLGPSSGPPEPKYK
ncbi:MAG TPA: glutamate ABC transporter substrate-binding protein [Streptomyces sp.]|nr:glutamate ABC transporter substrate-binding protein [Streptomyces sp.]